MIEIKNLSLRLGDFSLKDVNLTIQDGEYYIILGPTGAGKSVLMEFIAGLHRVRTGEIWLDGRNITHKAPEERGIGYVPQDYVLFPFLDVVGNIAFGLKAGRFSRAEIEDRIKAMSSLLGITHLLKRDIRSLSGGEKQRVALARALAPSPRILLLDEPLAALDQQTAKYLRLELKRIHGELGVTTLHITHNQAEAEEMADRIAVISMGTVAQVGKPEEVFFYPNSDVVSGFIGMPNILQCDSCRVLGHGLAEVSCGGLNIILPHDGDVVRRITFSPRDIFVSLTEPPGLPANRFIGTIQKIEPIGTIVRLELAVNGLKLRSEVPQHIFEEMELEVGKQVFLVLKIRRIRVLEDKAAINGIQVAKPLHQE
jgi:molybdate/tungstate transport system ATP-binding protein